MQRFCEKQVDDSKMKINVMISDDKTITLDVAPNESVENVKALLEVQTHVVLLQQRLFYDGSEIKNSDTLSSLSVKNGDLLILISKYTSILRGRELSLNPDGSAVNPAGFQRQHLLNSNHMTHLFESDLEFALALSGTDLYKIQDILRSRRREREVVMLCVDMEVNRVPVKAFVDSCAETSVISKSCADRCGLLRFLDPKFKDTAIGAGQTEIVGRIYFAPIKIGSNLYPDCSLVVFDISNMEVILGLDMLLKHKCTIDLQDNTLKLERGNVSVPFLQEKDIPSRFLGTDIPPGEASSSRATD